MSQLAPRAGRCACRSGRAAPVALRPRELASEDAHPGERLRLLLALLRTRAYGSYRPLVRIIGAHRNRSVEQRRAATSVRLRPPLCAMNSPSLVRSGSFFIYGQRTYSGGKAFATLPAGLDLSVGTDLCLVCGFTRLDGLVSASAESLLTNGGCSL